MHSELHERLEYLVNYSSQLIFVSGDSIAQQKKTLEAFVFQQHDDTEIAFITAEASMELSDYRRQLCRQLLGQVVGSYVRPLNELLADLNQHSGPILITITQAEHLPDRLLQELWDLVLQSRFASNKQHLNVLLFGETRWAESAKQWLPAKNTDTPLLISSQSVISEQLGSDLDRMIAKRREAFHAHLAKRQESSAVALPSNRLKSPWFWVGMTALFLAFFVAILTWLYGDNINSLFAPIDAEPTQQPQPQVVAGSSFAELADVEQALEASKNSPLKDESENAESGDNDQLVRQWKDAIAATAPVEKEPNDNEQGAADSALQTPITNLEDNNSSISDNAPAIPRGETPEESAEVATSDAGELKAVAADTARATSESVPEQPVSVQVDNAMLANTLRNEDFVIQLAGLKDGNLLQQFMADYELQSQVWIYRTTRYGGDWFVLIFHQPFSSLALARQAADMLPPFPGKENAFVKRGSQVLEELQQAGSE
ncbi:cell division protein DamX [Alteromonas pelagimontana]|uniref:Cell division protein DamX n=1 Tax=Alteromonas pelagimontana TaxID=1858656 RepID=A0A6M4MDB1_9ALTE|nr:AAA family ATPase [Alteromonas pelagimontana]QJR80555.1 cell division protein DamX [Alteromonas pelagimontana]